MFDHKLEPKPSVARRVEVFTGTGRRRRWSSDEKARILEETLAVGAVVSEVARRHGITSQQLFGWRRSARGRAIERSDAPVFAPVMLEAPAEKASLDGAVLEILVGAMVARVPVTADGATLAFYRKPAVDYAVAYRARIKQLGLDASKEEFQLRALEAVVNLYCSHHPNADVDTAKAAVLAAIKEAAP